MKYPKINSLWKRDPENKFQIMEGQLSREEFKLINKWNIFEKIHGQNIRIVCNISSDIDKTTVEFRGRTDKAVLPKRLLEYLEKTFTKEKILNAFEVYENDYEVVLFGEGYGAGINKGGKYRKDVSFVLFDVWVAGWWLKMYDVFDIADKLDIDTPPYIGLMTKEEIVQFVKSKPLSWLAQEEMVMEGIVARPEPLLLFRNKSPLLWKLKVKDYEKLVEQ